MRAPTLWLALPLVLSVTLGACGDDKRPGAPPATPGAPGSAGTTDPIDGTWLLQSAECAGRTLDLGANTVTLRFAGPRAEAAVRDQAGCTATLSSSAAYPAPGQLEVRDQSFSCVPASCSDACDAPLDTAAVERVAYQRQGDRLEFVSTASEGDEFCGLGEERRLVLIRQP
jgi:hypothetical protein